VVQSKHTIQPFNRVYESPIFEFPGMFAALHDISVKSAVIKFSMQRHRSSQTCCSGM